MRQSTRNAFPLLIAIVFSFLLTSNLIAAEKMTGGGIEGKEKDTSGANVGVDDGYEYLTEEYYERIETHFKEIERENEVLYYGIDPEDRVYLNVPVYSQETTYYCGPACLQMAIKYLTGRYISQGTLASQANTDSTSGTYVYKMRDTLNIYKSGHQYYYINL